MATKKQKRQAAQQRHEDFMSQYRNEGQIAQRFDRERRESKIAKAKLDELAKTKREKTTEALAKLLPKEPESAELTQLTA